MRNLFLLALLISTALGAQTITVPAPSCSVVCQPVQIVIPPAVPLPPVCVTPEILVSGVCVAPPPPTAKWMYLNGVKTLAGDFTGGGETTDYQHATTSGFAGGTRDILISSTVPWGYFIPYWSANYRLPNPGYTQLILSLKPSVTGDTFGIHAERVGDVGLPSIELLKYGPAAVAGKWASYVIPLKDLGVLGDATLYKIVLATHTSNADIWELDAIGFQ